MAISVGVNPPKTPVTEGSDGIAKVTTPNVCKMPGPPAPFVLTALPNIGRSGNSPKRYSSTVEIEGAKVAIRGATFGSVGDIASKGTGGGILSANTQGPTKFIAPGSPNVKIEGKNVHQLGEPMLNNCGPTGSPPNTGATLAGEDQSDAPLSFDQAKELLCVIFCECKVEAQVQKFETPVDPAAFETFEFGAASQMEPGKAQNQRCVERTLNRDYKNTNLVAEQSYDMRARPTPSPVPGQPPGSRRPDVIRLIDSALPARAPNIDVFEMKFPGDEYGRGQEAAYRRIGGNKPVTLIDSDECDC